MVKPVRMQVISANIKKYFTSIRGQGNIDSPFSNENPSLFAATNMHSNRNSTRRVRFESLSFLLREMD